MRARTLVVAILLTPALASAERVRVGLAPFHGPQGGRATAAIWKALSKDPRLQMVHVPRGASAPAADACEAGAHCLLLVRGELMGGPHAVRLAVFRGTSGDIVESFRLSTGQTEGVGLSEALTPHVAKWLGALEDGEVPETPAVAQAPAPAEAAPAAPEAAPATPEVPPAAPPPARVEAPPADAPIATPPARAAAQTPAPVVASAEAEPEPEPEAKVESSTGESSGSSNAPTVIELSAGGGTVSRWLSYNQDLFNALSTYSLGAGPLLAGSIEAYPFARWGGALSDVGVVIDVEHSVAVSSSTGTGPSLSTTESLYAGGLRIRAPFDAATIGVSAKYGVANFDFSVPAGSPALVPNYDYSFVEGALDGRVPFGSFALQARAGYMQVLGTSLQSTGYFPRAAAAGVEAQVGPAFAVNEYFELRLLADYRRFFFSMNPKPGDANVAGGALDQYLCATLEGVARFR